MKSPIINPDKAQAIAEQTGNRTLTMLVAYGLVCSIDLAAEHCIIDRAAVHGKRTNKRYEVIRTNWDQTLVAKFRTLREAQAFMNQSSLRGKCWSLVDLSYNFGGWAMVELAHALGCPLAPKLFAQATS